MWITVKSRVCFRLLGNLCNPVDYTKGMVLADSGQELSGHKRPEEEPGFCICGFVECLCTLDSAVILIRLSSLQAGQAPAP